MYNIKYHLPIFICELRKGASLKILPNGDFYVLNFFQKELCHLFNLDCRRIVKTIDAFALQLDELETVPVLFSDNSSQEINFHLYLEAGECLLENLSSDHSLKARHARAKLERRLIALRYRLEGCNGGWDPEEPDEGLFCQLVHAAQVWKNGQKIFPDKQLTAKDKSQLKETSRYSYFSKIVLSDEEVAEDFFLWALRDHIAVRPFIEFPHNQWKMNRYALNGRLSRRGGSDLKVQKIYFGDGYEKVLTLPFEGKPVNILDEMKSVLFRGNYGLTIKEVFEIFDYKRIEAGNLEYMEEGIINWNAHFWGYWDADLGDYQCINLDNDKWWNDLPVLDRISLKDARRVFGGHLTGVEWNLALISSRMHQDLNFENSHGYLSISVPQIDGSYIVYTLGKFTLTFPSTMLQAFLNLGETAEATIAYPDENVFYTHRRKTRYSYAISEREGQRFFDSVKRDMKLSREGNFVYQIESENCAKWSNDKLISSVGQHRVPEIYTMPFLNSEPHGVLKVVFRMIKFMPNAWQIPITIFIHFFLGGYKGRTIIENGKATWKSLMYHTFWSDTVIFHPSMLYKQQEEGKIGRFVLAGITLAGRAILRIFSQGEIFYQKILKHTASNFYGIKSLGIFSQSSILSLRMIASLNSQVAGSQYIRKSVLGIKVGI